MHLSHPSNNKDGMIRQIIAKLISSTKTTIYSILRLLSVLNTKPYIPILVYHSIGVNNSFFTVTPDEFARQISYLTRKYTIVSLEDVYEFVTGQRDLPKKSVAITCDDGYYDNYLNVFPYVKKYGVPIAIFVVSGHVGKEMTLGNIPLKMLDWGDIIEMSKNGVTIGAHTYSHPDLRRVSLKEAKAQIKTSKDEMEAAIGHQVSFFAYPKGAYNTSLFAVLTSLDFKAAFGGDGLTCRGEERYALKRVSIDASLNFSMFKASLTVATEWYRKIENFGAKLILKLPFLSQIANIYNVQER